jgi:hypothetical protein
LSKIFVNKHDELEKQLREKMMVQPGEQLEHNIFSEINQMELKTRSRLFFFRPIASMAVAAVAFIAIYWGVSQQTDEVIFSTPEVAQIMEYQEALENIELLSEFEDIELSDEDWQLLLADGGGASAI